MTRKDLEIQWRLNLSSILDDLTKDDFERLFLCLEEIPGGMKNVKHRMKMPRIIIERYGLEMSIKKISKAMDFIPRKDHKIQDLIQPMLEKLEALNQQHTKNKRRSAGAADNMQSPGRPSKRKRQPSPQPEMDSGTSMKAKRKKTKQKNSSLIGSSAALQKTSTPDLTKTIRDLKASGDLGQKVLTVKVVEKSDQYQSKTGNTDYFYLGVADETDAIKVVGFGRERFEAFEKGHFYTIRNARMDEKKVLKITETTRVSETGPFEVPRKVELVAEKIIFSPFYSIREIQSIGDKKEVSVEGTVKEIGVIKSIQMKAKRKKTAKRGFELEDGTGSITVDLWGDDTKHLNGISNGDRVLVTNLMTNLLEGKVSLNSTNSTRITKVQSAQVQSVNITIIGISKFDGISAELEVQIKNQVKTLEVSCPILAKAVGLRLDDDFKAKLLKKLKLKAKAEIQGNKIKQLEALA